MNNRDTTDLRKRLVKVIARRARSGEAGTPMAAARGVYDDLAVALVPLLSQPGFDALVARAFQLAQREYPADDPAGGDGQGLEPLGRVGLWLEQQPNQRNTIEAAAAMFEALAGLLTTLIGESLTTRYLRKAWPEDFSAGRSKGRRA